MSTLNLILCLIFFTGCATYNAATGRNEFIMISTPQEIVMGENFHGELEKQFEFSDDPEVVGRVERIGEEVAAVVERQDLAYEFYVVKKDELNAFTIPGGKIYVFTGLLDKLTTDDQLASVLAHELAHNTAKHSVKKFQAALGYDLLSRIALAQLEGRTQQVAALSGGVIMNLAMSAYSRRDELEADSLGLKYMQLAGYDLNGMIESFQILQKEEKGGDVPALLRTHPHLDDRIEAVKQKIPEVRAQY